MHHNLKCWPEYFVRVAAGEKTYEVRLNDRQYQAGDTVDLHEWDPSPAPGQPKYTGQIRTFTIGFVYAGDGVKKGHVVFSLLPRHTLVGSDD